MDTLQSIIDSVSLAVVFLPHGLFFVETGIFVSCFLQHSCCCCCCYCTLFGKATLELSQQFLGVEGVIVLEITYNILPQIKY